MTEVSMLGPSRARGISADDPVTKGPTARAKEATNPRSILTSIADDGIGPKMVSNFDDMRLGVDSDFAAAAFRHLSNAVRGLAADHERLSASLRKENSDLQYKLSAALTHPNSEAGTAKTIGTAEAAKSRNPWSVLPELARPQSPTLAAKDPVAEPDCQVQSPSSASGAPAGGSSPTNISAADLELTAASLEKSERERHAEKDMHWIARMGRLVRSPKFDSIIGAVIVANTLIMSLQLEYSGRVFKDEVLDKCGTTLSSRCGARNEGIEDFFIVMEHVFTGIFAFELMMRLFIEGCRYCRSVSNVLDAIVVLVSMADSWVLGPLGSDVMGSVAVLRLMRLMRLAKVLRVVRVMKAFRSLRVLVAAVVNSVGALGWSMTLLFVLELIGAIFTAQVIEPWMKAETDEDLQQFIWTHFGTWTNSMFTFFEITMAPGGFIRFRRLYEEVHPIFGIFFGVYVCVVTFAVVRVITAMFLKATLSASDSDEQDTAREKSEQWSNYVRSVGVKAETATAGNLTYEELESLLEIEHFAEWIQDVGLANCEVTRIFSALDQGTNVVNFSEFEGALKQMRGLPRAADVVINLYETRNILLRVIRMQERLDNTIDKITCTDRFI